jgi:hypothetical protein
MSNDFRIPPLRYLSDINDYTDEIHDIFNEHWKALDKKRQAKIDKIDQWCRDCRERINEYADKQKVLLNDDYDRLRRDFDKKHKDNLETANAYHIAQQIDLFKELRDACRLLKFRLAKLTFSKHEVEHPEVIIVEEQVEKRNSEEVNVDTQQNASRRRRREKMDGNKIENTSGASASSPPNPITSNSKQTECVSILKRLSVIVILIFIFSDQQSSETKFNRKNDHSQANTDNSKNRVMNDDESNNKCPICFMIFPLNMKRDNRQQHVNEHYTDD